MVKPSVAASPTVRRAGRNRTDATAPKDLRFGDVRRKEVMDRLGEKGMAVPALGERAAGSGAMGRGAPALGSEITGALSGKKQGGKNVDIDSLGPNRQDKGNRSSQSEQFGLSKPGENPNSLQLDHTGFSGDSRIMAGDDGSKKNTSGKSSTHSDKMTDVQTADTDSSGNTKERTQIRREETHIEDDGSRTFVTSTYDSATGEEVEAILKVDAEGNVTEAGTSKGKQVFERSSTTTTPTPEGAPVGSGKTWEQMSPKERAMVRKAGEARKQGLMNPGADGSGVSSGGELNKADARMVMKQKQNPYVNPGESGGGEAILGGPAAGSVTPGSAVDTLGGDTVDIGSSPEGSGNPLKPGGGQGAGSPH